MGGTAGTKLLQLCCYSPRIAYCSAKPQPRCSHGLTVITCDLQKIMQLLVMQTLLCRQGTTTTLLVTLTPSTGASNSSFAEITAVVYSYATGTVPNTNTVTITDSGSILGSTRLTPVNGSSFPSTFAGKAAFPWQPCGVNTRCYEKLPLCSSCRFHCSCPAPGQPQFGGHLQRQC